MVQVNRVTFPTFGFRLMYHLLQRQRVACSRSEVRAVYVSLKLLGKRAPARVSTTDSRHGDPRYPNLVKDLAITRPDQVWVADTTYFKIVGRTAYLALVEDAFTRRVVGYAIGFGNHAGFVLEALEMALCKGTPEIHHSDQGKQYASSLYTNRLLRLGVVLSMAAVGCAWENGLAERLNRTFKVEEIRRSEYQSLDQARRSIADYVKLYNQERIHMSLGYRTPQEVHRAYANNNETKG
jgi:transposase InsO family protein